VQDFATIHSMLILKALTNWDVADLPSGLFVKPAAHDAGLLEVVPDPCRLVNSTGNHLVNSGVTGHMGVPKKHRHRKFK
jgi:hypothetical protein